MATRKEADQRRDTVVKFRYPKTRAAILQLVADSETEGNVSEFMRRLTDQAIDEKLLRRNRAA